MRKNDFISQMVDETLGNITVEFEYCTKTKCYRLTSEAQVLEIPMNWSLFKGETTKEIFLTHETDNGLFLPILKEFLGVNVAEATLLLVDPQNNTLSKAA